MKSMSKCVRDPRSLYFDGRLQLKLLCMCVCVWGDGLRFGLNSHGSDGVAREPALHVVLV